MIKSMTGFGRGESVSEDCKVTVEIKAVNHRYCDLNMKLPRKLNYLEADIRSFLKQSIQRGKVDVFINYEDLSAKDVTVSYTHLDVYKRQKDRDSGYRTDKGR